MTGACGFIRGVTLIAVVAATSLASRAGLAQSLYPNPLLPSGVGSASDVDLGRGNEARGTFGRDRANPREANPADTLLRELNGTNNGRRSGSNALSDRRRRSVGFRGATGKVEGTAVRFETRGTYEEAIYGSRRGSYANYPRRRR